MKITSREDIDADQFIFDAIKKDNKYENVLVQHDYEIKFLDKKFQCCVGVVDIVNSTRLTSLLNPSRLTDYYSIFLNNLLFIATKFGAIIAKITGDGFLYYFPNIDGNTEENITKCISCNLMMTKNRSNINEILGNSQLPFIDYRISSEWGDVLISPIKIKNAIYEDIYGVAVNLCVKINHLAPPNKFVIGNDMFKLAKDLPNFSFKKIGTPSYGFYEYGVYQVELKV